MQWIIGHRPEHVVSRCYLYRYWSLVDSLYWDVESTLELDFKEANTPMGHSGPYSWLIYLIGTDYEG